VAAAARSGATRVAVARTFASPAVSMASSSRPAAARSSRRSAPRGVMVPTAMLPPASRAATPTAANSVQLGATILPARRCSALHAAATVCSLPAERLPRPRLTTARQVARVLCGAMSSLAARISARPAAKMESSSGPSRRRYRRLQVVRVGVTRALRIAIRMTASRAAAGAFSGRRGLVPTILRDGRRAFLPFSAA